MRAVWARSQPQLLPWAWPEAFLAYSICTTEHSSLNDKDTEDRIQFPQELEHWSLPTFSLH